MAGFKNGGGISTATSTGGSVTITNPNGPTTDFEVASGQDGINQLTGDVTAGPGVGSQAATLVGTTNVESIITNNPAVAASATDQLTGDVTTAAGAGSQAATLVSTSNVQSIVQTIIAAVGYLLKSGGTMTGAIAMGANKITGLANGSASSDAAAFGQIPTALPPNGSAGGDLTGTYPNPTLSGTANVESIIAANTTVTSKAPLASPTFTGVPAGPTATAGTNTTQLATTAFVTTAVASGGAVTSVFTRTGAVTAQTGDYTVAQVTGAAPSASPTFTGTPVAPTATAGTSTTQIATTAFVATSFAPLVSPTFTGTPAAPTATAGTSTTQIATTAFVATSFAPLASPALTGSPTAPTQTNTDNSTKIATTAFVQAHQTTALAKVVYAPSTVASYTVNATTLTALDTTNLTTGAFTIPASGAIKVTFSGGKMNNSNYVLGGLLNHSGGAQVGYTQYMGTSSNANGQGVTMVWVITGLTPGNSLQLDLAMYSSSCTFSVQNNTGINTPGSVHLLVEAI